MSEAHDEIMRSLGRIEGRLGNLEDLPKRVRALESWRSFLTGAWGILTLLAGYVGFSGKGS